MSLRQTYDKNSPIPDDYTDYPTSLAYQNYNIPPAPLLSAYQIYNSSVMSKEPLNNTTISSDSSFQMESFHLENSLQMTFNLQGLRRNIIKSENNRIYSLQKLYKYSGKYQDQVYELKKTIKNYPLDYEYYKKEALKEGEEDLIDKEAKYKAQVLEVLELQEQKYNNNLTISKLKGEGNKLRAEICAIKKALEVEKLRDCAKNDYELQDDIKIIENDIQKAHEQIEMTDKMGQEMMEQIKKLHRHNKFLRHNIDIVEDSSELASISNKKY